MLQVSNIRANLAHQLKSQSFVTDKSGVKTIEIIGQSFIADEPFIFGKVNHDYVERELEWYKSQSLFVKDIPGKTPAIWEAVSSSNGEINSNYGWCIWSKDNHNQYDAVLKELLANRDSRRAIMIYTRPTMHQDYNRDGMSDFMCTSTVQYMIRDNKLVTIVNMRSNDAIFGYRNDYAWQKYVSDMLANDLDIISGDIIWNAGSLHIYERHFSMVQDFINIFTPHKEV